jgi:hypothetical protein
MRLTYIFPLNNDLIVLKRRSGTFLRVSVKIKLMRYTINLFSSTMHRSIRFIRKFLNKKSLNIMNEESPKFKAKHKALNWLYVTLYEDEIIPRTSFKKFREENMYFLDGMNIASQMKEYNLFYFYCICKKVKLPITRNEVRNYFTQKGL